MASGKFVLRLPMDLHAAFQREAQLRQISLNSLILEKLGHASPRKTETQILQKVFKNSLIGVIQFGSTVRGEARADSDIDLLLVLDKATPIDRSLYAIWDKQIAPHLRLPYSPQFVHQPADWQAVSSLWLEVGLEGEVKFDPQNKMRSTLVQIKALIAAGEYERRISHGHPYWVRNSTR